MQDDHGLDVNLVLLATWAAGTGKRLDAVRAAELRHFADDYQTSVMQPLRQARRALKAQALIPSLAALLAERRRVLLALELDLERLEQLQLAALFDPPESGTDDRGGALLAANLYELYPDRPVPETALDVLAAVLAAAEPHAGINFDANTNG